MENRVVVIHSTQDGDIGRRVIAELEERKSMNLSRLFELQRESNRGIFSVLPKEADLTEYIKKRYIMYPLEGEEILPTRIQ